MDLNVSSARNHTKLLALVIKYITHTENPKSTQIYSHINGPLQSHQPVVSLPIMPLSHITRYTTTSYDWEAVKAKAEKKTQILNNYNNTGSYTGSRLHEAGANYAKITCDTVQFHLSTAKRTVSLHALTTVWCCQSIDPLTLCAVNKYKMSRSIQYNYIQ